MAPPRLLCDFAWELSLRPGVALEEVCSPAWRADDLVTTLLVCLRIFSVLLKNILVTLYLSVASKVL